MARSSGTAKEAKKLVRALRRLGYQVSYAKNGHAAVWKDGERIPGTGFSMTPPRTYDIRDKAIPKLRRAGIPITADDL